MIGCMKLFPRCEVREELIKLVREQKITLENDVVGTESEELEKLGNFLALVSHLRWVESDKKSPKRLPL